MGFITELTALKGGLLIHCSFVFFLDSWSDFLIFGHFSYFFYFFLASRHVTCNGGVSKGEYLLYIQYIINTLSACQWLNCDTIDVSW